MRNGVILQTVMKAGYVVIIRVRRPDVLLVVIRMIPTLHLLLAVLIVMGKVLVQIQVCQNRKIAVRRVPNINRVTIQDQLDPRQVIWIRGLQAMMTKAVQVVAVRRAKKKLKDYVNYIRRYLNVRKVLKALKERLMF